MIERQRHRDAFETYFQYKQSGKSVEEAIKLLRGDFNVTRKTLYEWKKKLNWDEKEAIRVADIQKKVEEKTNNSIADNKAKYLSVVHVPLEDYIQKVNKGELPVEINNTADIKRLVEIAMWLQGESQPVDVQVDVKSEIPTLPNDPKINRAAVKLAERLSEANNKSDEPGGD